MDLRGFYAKRRETAYKRCGEFSDRDHFKVFFSGAAFRTGPVHGDIGPKRSGRDAFIGEARRFVVYPSANQTHPGLEFLVRRFVITHGACPSIK